ncbi:MAG TPA: CoA transferase [Caulobacteraceae bacterium]|nr:CoA transferase [Caulobacteraceae bacterium]
MLHNALSDLAIVEGVSFVAGPTCGIYLAQMGAEVIRFDQIGGGPDYNRWPLSPEGASFYWESLNKGKKSVALDLARPEGRELAQRLAASTGLFVTNYPVDGFLSYERLKPLRENLIALRIMGWADGKPAVDYTVNAAVGVPLMTGPVDAKGPVNHVLAAWDLLTGAYAAFSLVTAERARRADGRGREVRLPLADVAMASMGHLGFVAEALLGDGDRPRVGNNLFGAFGRDFATKDGERLMVIAITPRQWTNLVGALGLAEAIKALEAELGVDFAADEGPRFTWRQRIDPLFEAAFAARTLAELTPLLDAAGVTHGPYQPTSVGARDPRLAENLFDVGHPSGHRYPTPGAAARAHGEERPAPTPAPRLGQHTDEVLSERLGLSAGELGRLHDQGLIEQT